MRLYYLLSRLVFLPLYTLTSCNAQLLDLNNIPLREGVIIDMERSEVHFTNSDSNLETVEIKLGKTQWNSEEKLKPLILNKGIIYCQDLSINSTNELIIKGIDPKLKGKQIFYSKAQLDKNIKIQPVRHSASNFTIEGRNISNELVLAWNYSSRVLKGMYDENDKSETKDFGFLTINSVSNNIKQMDKSKYKSTQFDVPVTVTKKIALNNKNSNQYQSRDAKHILVSTKVDDDLNFFTYQWEIFDATSQKKIGELKDYRAYTPFIVKDNILIYDQTPYQRILEGKEQEEPLKLLAYDLVNNKILWSKELNNFEPIELIAP